MQFCHFIFFFFFFMHRNILINRRQGTFPMIICSRIHFFVSFLFFTFFPSNKRKYSLSSLLIFPIVTQRVENLFLFFFYERLRGKLVTFNIFRTISIGATNCRENMISISILQDRGRKERKGREKEIVCI